MSIQVPSVTIASTNSYINQDNTRPIRTRRKTVDERLQDFFENSKINERRPLENFRGDRKIEAFRGKGFINKITTKLPTETTPKLEFIRNMQEVVINGKRTYLDNATILISNEGRGMFQVYRNVLGESDKGICVKVFRTYHQSVRRLFNSFADMRQDKYIMSLLSQIMHKKLI